VRRVLVSLSSLVAVACVTAAGASSSTVVPLPRCNVPLPQGGKATPLRAGVTYEARRAFPIVLRLTPPDGSWSGAQCKTSGRRPHSKGPPFFGWVGAVQTPETPGAAPRGAIEIVTSYTRTRSATATATQLRAPGHGAATYGPISRATFGGFSGLQFDGTVTGKLHNFIPFSPHSRKPRFYADSFELGRGAVFRIIVLQVRTKTVVVFIEPAGLPQGQFPAFLEKADSILQPLEFPR
jgi:hypothetical protein